MSSMSLSPEKIAFWRNIFKGRGVLINKTTLKGETLLERGRLLEGRGAKSNHYDMQCTQLMKKSDLMQRSSDI